MGDVATFPTIRNVLWTTANGANVHKFTATAAVKAGQVVAYAATGLSGAINPAVKGTTAQPIGVALDDAAAGTMVAVACNGCICYVANFSTTVALDAGDIVEDNANAIGGTVSLAALTSTAGGGTVATVRYTAGVMIDDCAASATGRMLVKCGLMTAPMTA
jgi:hypothetical protein